MRKLLLTGFEPFLHYPKNPTMEIVEALNGQVIDEIEIVGRTLVVDFNESARQFKQIIQDIEPDLIISLGLAGGRAKITPERIAINVKDGEVDNAGYAPTDEPIYPNEADGLFSTLPIRPIVNKLREAGYPAEISNTAGTYLCNNIMYEGLRYAKSKEHIMAGFIHIPADFELAIANGKIPGWNQQDLLVAVKIAIGQSIEAFHTK
ncbi:MAG: pyroglutamyl-peptidase I [Kurthia sp.]|nr:pyroglutamyl-peptidase I [Candidatus Kurthia equi]